MKRLLDESTDDLTRSLLSAGVEHRPPAGNKAQVMMALGAGSALGLFSSNAFAWLGTTAGKVTAAGVAVGLAGAVFVAASGVPAREGGHADASGARDRAVALNTQDPALAVNAQPDVAPVRGVASGGAASAETSELSANNEALPLITDEAGEPGASQADERAATGENRVARSSERRKAWARKNASKKRRALASEAPVEEDEASVAAASNRPAALEVAAPEASALDTEVRLVDDMHGAARRNDRVALARYVDAYRESFPDGQLKKEVAEFAARLERSDVP
jgi:hypothetical protein